MPQIWSTLKLSIVTDNSEINSLRKIVHPLIHLKSSGSPIKQLKWIGLSGLHVLWSMCIHRAWTSILILCKDIPRKWIRKTLSSRIRVQAPAGKFPFGVSIAWQERYGKGQVLQAPQRMVSQQILYMECSPRSKILEMFTMHSNSPKTSKLPLDKMQVHWYSTRDLNRMTFGLPFTFSL